MKWLKTSFFLVLVVILFIVMGIGVAHAIYYEGDDIKFSWSYCPGAFEYVIEIDDSFHLFGDYSWFLPFRRNRTFFTSCTYYNFPAGAYYWHVLACDYLGYIIGYTDVASFTVYARPSYYYPSPAPSSITAPQPLSVQKESRGTIKGKVMNTAGQPIAGATVKAFDIWGGYSERPTDPFATTTDANGDFVLSNLRDGIYDLHYEASGYISQKQERLTTGAGQTRTTPTVIMSPYPGEIRGRVLSNLGRPIPGTAVRMHNILTPNDNSIVPTNPGGEFRFSHISDGIYHVYYDAPGYIGQVQHNIGVQGGVTTTPTVIMLPGAGVSASTGEIFGRVVNQVGHMIPGTCIRIDATLMPTNPAGEFRFTLVSPGIYTVYYDAPGYKGQTQSNITVNAGQTTICPTVIMLP